jgi:hypothetical protein
LTAQLFCHAVTYYRRHDSSLKGRVLSGFCGTADNLAALELGIQEGEDGEYTLEALYQALVDILEIVPSESKTLSLELLHTLAAKAGRNGFGLLTQSPFKTYHAALLRQSISRDSPQHQAHIQQIASTLFGKDHLERGMDRLIEALVAPEIAAVFALTARCNHSCNPNAQVQSQEFVDAHIDLVALEEIAAGQEILISYIAVGSNVGKKSRIQRQRELQAKYLFVCDCSKCSKS